MLTPIRRAAANAASLQRFSAHIVMVVIVLAACVAPTSAPRTITLRTLNDSGVTGTVSFSDLGGKTGVDVEVSAAGNLDMPAHIHPGTCDNLTPLARSIRQLQRQDAAAP